MMSRPSLRSRVEDFVEHRGHPAELRSLLKQCVEDGTIEGLACLKVMYEHMYGGMTYNYEIKAPAASTMLVWKELGLKELTESAKTNPEFKNIGIALALLSSLAARESLPSFGGEVGEPSVDEAIKAAMEDWPDLAAQARSRLVEIVLSMPDDEDVASTFGFTLQQAAFTGRSGMSREIFAAVSRRWLAVSTPVLDRFDQLINTRPRDEPAFQEFFCQNPHLLDPLAIRVWPQPNLFGFKEPDYIIQRADGTYIVIEIECPGKSLVTSANHLSADVTHAEQQSTDYRRNILRKHADLRLHLPNLQEPDCLVVIGLERDLDPAQKQILHDANMNRNHLRIVGFDWLLDRARTIASNVTQPSVAVQSLRVV